MADNDSDSCMCGEDGTGHGRCYARQAGAWLGGCKAGMMRPSRI